MPWLVRFLFCMHDLKTNDTAALPGNPMYSALNPVEERQDVNVIHK